MEASYGYCSKIHYGEDMREKMTIIVFINNYLPGVKAGGPVRSIANLVEHLGNKFNFKIITSDRDLGDKTAYSNIDVDKWNTVGNASVFYMSPKYKNMKSMLRILKETPHDVIYINSFFNFIFSVVPLIMYKLKLVKKPVIIAPRGELMDGSIRIRYVKKKIYMTLSHFLGIYDNCMWQASNELEASSIKKIFLGKIEAMTVTSNLASVTYIDIGDHAKKIYNHLNICYVSRISEKKNLIFVLEILSQVKEDITISIYAPIEDVFYWNRCQKFINNLPKNVKVEYKGVIDNSIVVKTISNYDLFFLPTLGENFGHCIVEAMLAGTPVLISDTTPWRDLESKGVGWDKSLSRPQDFLDVVNKLIPMGEDEYLPLKKRVLSYAKDFVFDEESIQKNINMFLNVHN